MFSSLLSRVFFLTSSPIPGEFQRSCFKFCSWKLLVFLSLCFNFLLSRILSVKILGIRSRKDGSEINVLLRVINLKEMVEL